MQHNKIVSLIYPTYSIIISLKQITRKIFTKKSLIQDQHKFNIIENRSETAN